MVESAMEADASSVSLFSCEERTYKAEEVGNVRKIMPMSYEKPHWSSRNASIRCQKESEQKPETVCLKPSEPFTHIRIDFYFKLLKSAVSVKWCP